MFKEELGIFWIKYVTNTIDFQSFLDQQDILKI